MKFGDGADGVIAAAAGMRLTASKYGWVAAVARSIVVSGERQTRRLARRITHTPIKLCTPS